MFLKITSAKPTVSFYLHRVNMPKNQHRFYAARIDPDLFGCWSLFREWGRIGSAGQLRVDSFPTEQEARGKLAQLHRQKIRKGYQKV